MMDPRLKAAMERGKLVRAEMARDEGGSYSLAQTAKLLHIRPGSVLRRWRSGKLVAWQADSLELRFPRWQFQGGMVLTGIVDVLQVIPREDQWAVMHFFLCQRLSLRKRRVLDLLRKGDLDTARVYAQAENEL